MVDNDLQTFQSRITNVKGHKVWTFLLISGSPVRIVLPGNPSLDFTGVRTIWHLVGSQEVADNIQALLKSLDIVAERFCEGQSDEQKEIRQELLNGTYVDPVI